jgi:hypothetical protein
MQITMDDRDFARLVSVSDRWAEKAGYWADILERFELPQGGQPSLRWKRAYWMGSYAAVILGRAFLAERGQDYEIVYDWQGDPDDDAITGWVILTSYEALGGFA